MNVPRARIEGPVVPLGVRYRHCHFRVAAAGCLIWISAMEVEVRDGLTGEPRQLWFSRLPARRMGAFRVGDPSGSSDRR